MPSPCTQVSKKKTLSFAWHELIYCTVVLTLGGSVVILMPTCRMEIGNSGCGLLLSHNLKSGCGSSTCSCSTSLSSWGIQLKDKWQLAKNTQLPWNNRYRDFSLSGNCAFKKRRIHFKALKNEKQTALHERTAPNISVERAATYNVITRKNDRKTLYSKDIWMIKHLGRKWTYVFYSFFDHARGYWGLALTQREGMEPIWHPRVLSKL